MANSIKADLEAKKADILKRIAALNKDIRHENKPTEKDFSEQVTEAENDDVLRRLFEESNRELKQINKALDRIESGEYGKCANCGNIIKEERLKAVLFATHCIKCAE